MLDWIFLFLFIFCLDDSSIDFGLSIGVVFEFDQCRGEKITKSLCLHTWNCEKKKGIDICFCSIMYKQRVCM